MGMFDDLSKTMQLPGKLVKEAAKTAAQVPAVPFNVADKAREGLEDGIQIVTKEDK